jgi:hypothetical protein
MTSSTVPVLTFERTDRLQAALEAVSAGVARHPAACQAAFAALAAEGRRFAATPEGAELRARLGQSELIARARLLWDGLFARQLEPRESQTRLPGELLEELLGALGQPGLEGLISRVHERR